MTKKNVGKIDRVLRIVVGIALLAGFAFNPSGSWSWLYLIGIIPLVTGLMSSCPAYSVLGMSTCSTDQK